MAQNKRSPMAMEVVKGIVFLLFGVALIVQPWLRAVSWLGWVIVAAGALIAGVMLLRIRNAKRMLKTVVAEFDSGDVVYASGLRVGGYLYDFSTFGAEIQAATLTDSELRIEYGYYAKKRGRTKETVTIPLAPGEQEKAQTVLAHLNVPEIVEQTEEEKQAAQAEPLPAPEDNRKEV